MGETITSAAASAIPGTPAYFSPELATAVLDEMRTGKKARYAYAPTDDVYSLGGVFYEVLASEVPCCEIKLAQGRHENGKVSQHGSLPCA